MCTAALLNMFVRGFVESMYSIIIVCLSLQLGNTALHIASRDGLVDVVCVLLEHGPKAVLLNRTKVSLS